MTKKSLMVIGGCVATGALAAWRRRAKDVRARAEREASRCERLLRGLDARCANFR